MNEPQRLASGLFFFSFQTKTEICAKSKNGFRKNALNLFVFLHVQFLQTLNEKPSVFFGQKVVNCWHPRGLYRTVFLLFHALQDRLHKGHLAPTTT